MQAAYEWVTDIIEEDGPYDGVMGFSAVCTFPWSISYLSGYLKVHLRLPADTKTKGGGLGAAVILHHQLTNPYKPRLFRFAIFICAPLPWSIDRTSGVDVTSLIVGDVKVPVELLDIQKSLEEARNGSGETSTTNPPESVPNALRDAVSEVRRTIDGPYDHEQHPIRRFHPEVDLTRIELPTAHIVGKNDQVSDSSHQLIQLCDEKHAGVYEHAGGHEVWRTAGDLEMIKNLILKTVARGELM